MNDTDKQDDERQALGRRAAGRQPEAVQESSRPLWVEAWLWDLAYRMPEANRLTVTVTALVLARYNLFP